MVHGANHLTGKRFGKKVSHEDLVDQNRVDQIKYEELRSMVKGMALERAVINPKKGNAKGYPQRDMED